MQSALSGNSETANKATVQVNSATGANTGKVQVKIKSILCTYSDFSAKDKTAIRQRTLY